MNDNDWQDTYDILHEHIEELKAIGFFGKDKIATNTAATGCAVCGRLFTDATGKSLNMGYVCYNDYCPTAVKSTC